MSNRIVPGGSPGPARRTGPIATGAGSTPATGTAPATVNGKMGYAKNQGLGGAFFWELSGDTTGGELITAMNTGLS